MNKTSHSESSKPQLPIANWKTTIGVTITVLALAYLFFRPILNQQFGWNLPDPNADEKQVAENEQRNPKKNPQAKKSDAVENGNADNETVNRNGSPDGGKTRDTKDGPQKEASTSKTDASKNERSSANSTKSNSSSSKKEPKQSSARGPPPSPGNSKSSNGNGSNAKSQPKLGELTEISSGLFKSTAGLVYGKGSREGTRLKHIMQHAKDDLSKPVHGVFDGSQTKILELIDHAYLLALKNDKRVSVSKQQNRTVYTIYFSSRIGFIGGQKGKRTRNPMAKELSLVLEGDRIITAYPK